MQDHQLLYACVLGSFLLVGCTPQAQSPEVFVPSEHEAVSRRIEPIARPILLTGQSLQGFIDLNIAQATPVSDFRQYFLSQVGQRVNQQHFRQQLKLKAEHLLLIGRDDEATFNLQEFVNNDLFASANDLVINHVRWVKTPELIIQDEGFSNSAAYQNNIAQARHEMGKLSQHIFIDAGRLEDALNFLSRPIRLDLNDYTAPIQVHYDSNTQKLLLQTSSLYLAGGGEERRTYSQWIGRVPPQQAKTIEDVLHAEQDDKTYLGLIFEMTSKKQLVLEQAVVYQRNNIDGQINLIAKFPLQQLSITRNIALSGSTQDVLAQQQNLRLDQIQPFQFGSAQYRDPEKILAPSDSVLTVQTDVDQGGL